MLRICLDCAIWWYCFGREWLSWACAKAEAWWGRQLARCCGRASSVCRAPPSKEEAALYFAAESSPWGSASDTTLKPSVSVPKRTLWKENFFSPFKLWFPPLSLKTEPSFFCSHGDRGCLADRGVSRPLGRWSCSKRWVANYTQKKKVFIKSRHPPVNPRITRVSVREETTDDVNCQRVTDQVSLWCHDKIFTRRISWACLRGARAFVSFWQKRNFPSV